RVRRHTAPYTVANSATLRHQSNDVHSGHGGRDRRSGKGVAALAKLLQYRPSAVVLMSKEPAVDIVVERGDGGAAENDDARAEPVPRRGMERRCPRADDVARGMENIIADHPPDGLATGAARCEKEQQASTNQRC